MTSSVAGKQAVMRLTLLNVALRPVSQSESSVLAAEVGLFSITTQNAFQRDRREHQVTDSP